MNQDFQDILDALPEKPARSRLEPYRPLIEELRRRGRTYQEIVRILEEKCQLHTAVSTVNDFMRRSSRTKQNPSKNTKRAVVDLTGAPPATTGAARWPYLAKQQTPLPEEVRQRIAALKQRPVLAEAVPKLFHYDPDEPLRLLPKTEKTGSEQS
jgi:hypothetical protein